MVYDIFKKESWFEEENINNIISWINNISDDIHNEKPRAILSYYKYDMNDFLERGNIMLKYNQLLEYAFNKGIYSSWLIVDYVIRSLNIEDYNSIVSKEESDKNIKALIEFLIKEYDILIEDKIYKTCEETSIYIRDIIERLVYYSFFKVDIYNRGSLNSKDYRTLIEYGTHILTLNYSMHYLKRDL